MTAQLDVEALVGLKRCPFCNSAARKSMAAVSRRPDAPYQYKIGCSTCDDVATNWFLIEEEAVAAWNRRAGEDAWVAAAVAGAWIAPRSVDDMPVKPGLSSYEYVECLILHKGDLLTRPWNCEHKVFDDEQQDDFFCEWDDITAYRVIGHERDAAKSAAAIRKTPQ